MGPLFVPASRISSLWPIAALVTRRSVPILSGARRSVPTLVAASAGTLDNWAAATDNTLLRDLRKDGSSIPWWESREVTGAHYVSVRPTVNASDPTLIIHSPEVAASLGLSVDECESEAFLKTFGGAPAENVECWATAYGASFAGSYGGQRGDGRAISIGQLKNGLEVQLKGAGVTPFSRRFDGRAVLRSCVREFLASEAMAALGIPTTRALCVVATGEKVRRSWYDDNGL